MRSMKKLFYIIGLLIVILPFQNCGMLSSFTPGQSLSSNGKSESGNGGGYEGKPDGTYYHFIPNYTCAGTSTAEQITEIKNGQAFLYTNKDNKCADQSAPIPVADVNVSPFQNEFISVKDSLFKRYDQKPDGIPTNLAEVLCRDDFNNPTFEIVSHYDRENNEALTRIYLPDQKIPDFSVSRILSMNEVRYVASGITFKVDLSKPAYADRKFAGQIESSTIGKVSPRPLVCVIGGSIDTSKWSLKALTNRDVTGSFQVMKNNEIVFFSVMSKQVYFGRFYTYVMHLFKIGADNFITDFSKMIFGDNYNVIYQNGTVGDVLSLYSARADNEAWTSDFFYDSRTGKARRLTNLVPGAFPEAYNYQHPVLTADEHMFYDTYVLDNSMDRNLTVKVYDFKSDTVENVASLGDTGNTYIALPKSNRLVITWRLLNDLKNVMQIYEASSKQSHVVTIQMPQGCYLGNYGLRSSGDEASILASRICDAAKTDVVRISLADGAVKTVGVDTRITWVSADNNRIVMTDAAGASAAYDLRSDRKIEVPVSPRFGDNSLTSGLTDYALLNDSPKMVLASDRYLYGFGGKIEAPTMYKTDLTSGVSTAVCEAAIGKKLYAGLLPNQKVFLLTYDSNLKIYRFYQVKGASDCVRINEFPSNYLMVSRLNATNIGFGLVLGKEITVYKNESAAEAVFVPIDGRPPLKFNPNSDGQWQMEVSPDRNRLVLSGPDTDGETKIFSFEL